MNLKTPNAERFVNLSECFLDIKFLFDFLIFEYQNRFGHCTVFYLHEHFLVSVDILFYILLSPKSDSSFYTGMFSVCIQ